MPHAGTKISLQIYDEIPLVTKTRKYTNVRPEIQKFFSLDLDGVERRENHHSFSNFEVFNVSMSNMRTCEVFN